MSLMFTIKSAAVTGLFWVDFFVCLFVCFCFFVFWFFLIGWIFFVTVI